jgi:hypothetical protein
MAPKPRKDLSVLFLSDEYQQIGNGTILLTVRQGDLFSKPTHLSKSVGIAQTIFELLCAMILMP